MNKLNKALLISAIVFIAIIVSIAITVINFSNEVAKLEGQNERLADARQDLLDAEAELAEARAQALLNR